MATIRMQLAPEEALFKATGFPQYKIIQGTAFPVGGLFFDASAVETAFWRFILQSYGSGNITCNIYWYADTASTGGVAWRAYLAAITPDTDSQDVETDALASANQGNDTHLGTTGQRIHKAEITISNLDSAAGGDLVFLAIDRYATDATNDTMTGDAAIVGIELTYSDT